MKRPALRHDAYVQVAPKSNDNKNAKKKDGKDDRAMDATAKVGRSLEGVKFLLSWKASENARKDRAMNATAQVLLGDRLCLELQPR